MSLHSARKILIAEPLDFSPKARDILSEVGEVELRRCSGAALAEAFKDYDIIWLRLATKITTRIIGDDPRCRMLAAPLTGLDHIDLDSCKAHGIQVIALKGETEFLRDVRATAELNLALAFAVMRRIPEASASVLDGIWDRDRFRGHELFGKTAGIIGVGRLGSVVASYLDAFGVSVLGYDPLADFSQTVARRVDTLEDLLTQADIVFVLVTYDQSTHHLMGRREFAFMKPGSYLVNTSRGGVIDESAMLQALADGRLAGVALDVLEGEPQITSAHRVVEFAKSHPNVVIVPHIGGNTVESFEKTEVFLAKRVVQALAGDVAIKPSIV
jgi:D-3-phosphoglycerate dehydrogenase